MLLKHRVNTYFSLFVGPELGCMLVVHPWQWISVNPDLLGYLYENIEECTPLDREDSRVRVQPETPLK